MALGLTQNASTANQFCVPCCHGAVGRCCTPELIASNTESLFIHFHNYKQLSLNEYVDIFIEDFTVELRRYDLIDVYTELLDQNYNFSNWQSGAEYIQDIFPAGFDLNQMFIDLGVFIENSGRFYYFIPSRLTPVKLIIQPKTFIDNSYAVPYRFLPLPGFDKNSNYFANGWIRCTGNSYLAKVDFYRSPVSSDRSNPNIENLIYLIPTFGSSAMGSTTAIDHCGPMAGHGTCASLDSGFWGQLSLIGSPALAYFSQEALIDGNWVFQNNLAVIPYFTMDFYISE